MNEEIKHLMDTARRLHKEADNLEISAQKLCTHKKDDGSWSVYTGFGVGIGGEECDICRLPACYIKGWS